MKKLFFTLCCILVVLGTSCGKPPAAVQKSPTVATQNGIPTEATSFSTPSPRTVTPSLSFTGTPTTESTVTEYTQTTTITPTPTIPPEANLDIQCLNIAPDLPPEMTSNGSLVFVGEGRRNGYLLDLTTMAFTQINQPEKRIIDIDVSPGGEWIAYIEGFSYESGKSAIQDILIIADANNQINRIIPWEEEWGFITAWLDDTHLVIDIPPDNIPTTPATLMTLNPFTGERQIIKPEYPDIYQFPPIPYWKGWGETVYDPTLTRVVYLRGGQNNDPSPLNYVLWDMTNNKSLASFRIIGDLDTIPRWYTDGEQYAFAPGLITDDPQNKWPAYEVIRVDRNGLATQLSHLAAYYQWTYISDLSWSPDGEKIAFWFGGWDELGNPFFEEYELHLAVVDVSSGKVTNYCVPGDAHAQIGGLRLVPPPIWSHDSKQLVVENLISNINKRSSRVILVDIEKNLAAVIAEDMQPAGWVDNP